jgi:hypothetical protein
MSFPNLISVLTQGRFNSDQEELDLVSIVSKGWFASDEIVEDYREFSALPNNYFQEEAKEYDRESLLFDLLYTEAINLNGVPMVYYINSYNTKYDKTFGEDNNRNVIRNFNVQAYYELPNEDQLWNSFGIEGIDNFHVQITMRHMEAASQFNSNGTSKRYPSYIPRQGDYMKAKYNEYFYEIVTVKEQVGQFLKRQHVFDLICRPMRDEKLSVSASVTNTDTIRNINDIEDIFDITPEIEREKSKDMYQPKSGESSPDPLFGTW